MASEAEEGEGEGGRARGRAVSRTDEKQPLRTRREARVLPGAPDALRRLFPPSLPSILSLFLKGQRSAEKMCSRTRRFLHSSLGAQ
eukprot:scaffold158601_cov30-Tisochrysis_lutea.AAC.6